MKVKDNVLYIEKKTYTKEQLETELESLKQYVPTFNSEEYEAGNDRYFYELELRDERIEEINQMLLMFV